MAARARNRFGPVWALDPFGVTGNESAAYNPLDLLDPGSECFAEDAAALADAIVSDPPGEVREAHWNEEAVALLSGLILLCASSEPPARRNLARVRAYLTQPPSQPDRDRSRRENQHRQGPPGMPDVVIVYNCFTSGGRYNI